MNALGKFVYLISTCSRSLNPNLEACECVCGRRIYSSSLLVPPNLLPCVRNGKSFKLHASTFLIFWYKKQNLVRVEIAASIKKKLFWKRSTEKSLNFFSRLNEAILALCINVLVWPWIGLGFLNFLEIPKFGHSWNCTFCIFSTILKTFLLSVKGITDAQFNDRGWNCTCFRLRKKAILNKCFREEIKLFSWLKEAMQLCLKILIWS